MTPIHETTIRELWRGYYEVEHDGRHYSANSREELRMMLKDLIDVAPDPDLIDQIRDLEQDVLDRIAD